MTETITRGPYGALTAPATLTIERLLPGPVERVWRFLTDAELRRKWLAAGPMDLREGGDFEFIWRNDELTPSPGRRPDGFGEEHRMSGTVTECEPPHLLSITWGRTGGVTFRLAPRNDGVLLTVTHRRVPDRDMLLMVSAGWHVHLDVLVAVLTNGTPAPFWDEWQSLRTAYAERLPGA